MTHPSEDYNAPLHPFERSHHQHPESKHLVGIELFEKAFNFYAWYLSYDHHPAKNHGIFELLSILMQIAKVSFEGGAILSSQEEAHALKELYELSEALSNGQLKNKDLFNSLEKVISHLTHHNAKAKVVSLLMKLEYKLCIHHEANFGQATQKKFREIVANALEKIDKQLPSLIANTVARELDSLYKSPLDEVTFLKKFSETMTLLKHVY
jgi:hypothetical protein